MIVGILSALQKICFVLLLTVFSSVYGGEGNAFAEEQVKVVEENIAREVQEGVNNSNNKVAFRAVFINPGYSESPPPPPPPPRKIRITETVEEDFDFLAFLQNWFEIVVTVAVIWTLIWAWRYFFIGRWKSR